MPSWIELTAHLREANRRLHIAEKNIKTHQQTLTNLLSILPQVNCSASQLSAEVLQIQIYWLSEYINNIKQDYRKVRRARNRFRGWLEIKAKALRDNNA